MVTELSFFVNYPFNLTNTYYIIQHKMCHYIQGVTETEPTRMQNNPTVSITVLLFAFHDCWSSGLRSESLGFLLLHEFLQSKHIFYQTHAHSPETMLAVQAKAN